MLFCSDLAIERHRANTARSDISLTERRVGRLTVSHLRVTGEEGAHSIERPQGLYITISHPEVFSLSREERQVLTREVEEALRACLGRRPARLLAVGLGNRRLTADSFGCRAVDGIFATARLLEEGMRFSADQTAIATLTPGVTGECGLETAETVAAVAERFRADAVLVFDALASGGTERLLRTVQISDSGMAPGSGMGLRRAALDAARIGCPVVGVGIPTVMRAEAYLQERLSATASHAPPAQTRETDGLFVQRQSTEEEIGALAALVSESVNQAFGFSP